MTMTELSRSYEEAAVLLRRRLRYLRQALAATADPEEIWHIKRRIAEERGVNKSTVCRTLKRAETKLRRFLQY